MNTIGKIIRYKRKNKAMSQRGLAKELGVSTTTVGNWEREYSYPGIIELCDLADFFECSTDELLGRTPIK